MKRIALASLLGGLAMFIWSFVAHMFLPLGETGIQDIPNEQAILSALETSLGKNPGLYFFPAMGAGPNATGQQRQAAMERYSQKLAVNPSGILVYHPPGAQAITPAQLITEFLTEVLETLLAVTLLSQTRITSFGGRLGFIALAGVLVAITTNVSYWNWYGFPALYTASYMFTQMVGFVCAGLVVASIFKKQPQQAAAMTA